MSDMYSNDTPTPLVPMTYRKLVFVIACGAVAGLATWGLAYLLDAYIYKAILCSGNAAVQCASSYQYATTTATILGGAVGLFGLVRLRVFRPLLVVIAAYIALWGLLATILPLPWYGAAGVVAVLYGLAFGAFAWLARIRNFYIAIIILILVIAALRFVLNS
ncbi:MAG: hypothetical protein ABWX90_00530 [Candidatus Saccharimonadales bacterium]